MLSTLTDFFERDLLKLREELHLYADEQSLWVLQGDIANSAGNLCLHLIGNLNHFIGAQLGHSGYLRQRDLEFSRKNVPRAELIAGIDQTIEMVKSAFSNLTDADLETEYPLEKHGQRVTTGYMLAHLLTHLNYHLGQVNYHRRGIIK